MATTVRCRPSIGCRHSGGSIHGSVALTASGEARFKAAQGQWRKAQKGFESAFGASDAEELRATLRRSIAVT